MSELEPKRNRPPKNVLKVKGRPVPPLIPQLEFYRERGRRIHKARLALGLSRKELAELTGYAENSIKQLETRGRGMSLYKFWLFERVLGEI